MTPSQKRLRELTERQSRERQRMSELALLDELDDETRSELDKLERGTADVERQLRAARQAVEDEEKEAEESAAANEPDAEQRERIELRSKASLTSYVTAALSGRQVSGPEAELRDAAGIADGVPLELWDVPPEIEQRADVQTDAPGTVGVNLAPIQPAVFARSVAPRLGIEMPRVQSGTFASATISTSLSAAAKDQGAAQESSAAQFTTTTATPKRISARLSIQIEDVAAVGVSNFESSLRENLALVLSDALDDQALNGDGSAPNLTGIFQGLTDPNAPTSEATFDDYVAAFADGIDGLWASNLKEVSIVCGPATYAHSAKTFRDPATGTAGGRGDKAFADYAMSMYGGWWTNKRMPDAASDIQQAILYRKGRSMMGGQGAMKTAVCPHWGQISIDDIFSSSASGVRHFTIHVLLGDVILVQPSAYQQVSFQLA